PYKLDPYRSTINNKNHNEKCKRWEFDKPPSKQTTNPLQNSNQQRKKPKRQNPQEKYPQKNSTPN
ncbi:hypothetical protein, partial [Neisseria sp. P0016.S005]|uniref:hypothetical protein n=1 Tax=Neisseria sp. P0016.S005 TaxID=3436771 RepID=UPI003F7F8BD9